MGDKRKEEGQKTMTNEKTIKPVGKAEGQKDAKDGGRSLMPLIISPLAVMAVIFAVYAGFGFYPFGTRTIAWADMNQQVVPLLCQFKDILDGKGGMFLSFKNSSGMNFWGIFFFFLSSPFSLLVKFVKKEDMLVFMNLLVVLKMMCCAASASLYFLKSSKHTALGTAEVSLLGSLYAVCGYTMLFYQNVIWLDVMYLFPLLMLSMEHLFDRKKGSPLPYTLLMAAMVIVNYYLGYMIVVYVLLFMGLYAVMTVRQGGEQETRGFLWFIAGSAAAAMISAVVWLPSFMQYLTSGRKVSLFDNLRMGEIVTNYVTVLPILFCSAGVLILAALDAGRAVRYKPAGRHKLDMIMTALMLVPIFIEPINKMWHTGSYMAFPARYGFMTIFMLLTLSAYALEKKYVYGGDSTNCVIWSAEGLLVIGLYFYITVKFIDIDIPDLSVYTDVLNGNDYSFKGLLRLLILGTIILGSIFITYRKGLIPKGIFLALVCLLSVFETLNNARIYMTSSGILNEGTYALQREVTKLSDRIVDDSFYRVKTNAKIFDYNMIGAMDYNSIGSYTSLNEQEYLYTMKRMGYTSVWMEIGTCGGTELTDALLSVGYQIDHTQRSDTLFSLDSYNINRQPYKLPLGICLDRLPEESEIPPELDRTMVQSYISQTLFGEDIIDSYQPAEGSFIMNEEDKYTAYEGDIIIYRIHVDGRKTIYFDCFDRLSTDLSEEVYDSFKVQANGKTICKSYPYSKNNGALRLGSFSDENVIIQLTALDDVECGSLGVFSVDTDRLARDIAAAQCCDLREIKNGIQGTADTDAPKTVLLSIPYNKGFELTVNGNKTACREVLSGFTAFDLPAGHSDIRLKLTPRGFRAGAAMSVLGLAAFALLAVTVKRRRGEQADEKGRFICRVCTYLTAALGALVLILVYIMPFAVNILFWTPDTNKW